MQEPLMAQMVKSLPAVQETRVWYLCWEDALEKEMAAHSSILVWRILRMEEPSRLQSMRSQRVRHNWATSLSLFTFQVLCMKQGTQIQCTGMTLRDGMGREVGVLHWKNWCLSWSSNTLATWCEELTHWKRPWWWKRSKVKGEGDGRGWDG